jgi:hypothetical protein
LKYRRPCLGEVDNFHWRSIELRAEEEKNFEKFIENFRIIFELLNKRVNQDTINFVIQIAGREIYSRSKLNVTDLLDMNIIEYLKLIDIWVKTEISNLKKDTAKAIRTSCIFLCKMKHAGFKNHFPMEDELFD